MKCTPRLWSANDFQSISRLPTPPNRKHAAHRAGEQTGPAREIIALNAGTGSTRPISPIHRDGILKARESSPAARAGEGRRAVKTYSAIRMMTSSTNSTRQTEEFTAAQTASRSPSARGSRSAIAHAREFRSVAISRENRLESQPWWHGYCGSHCRDQKASPSKGVLREDFRRPRSPPATRSTVPPVCRFHRPPVLPKARLSICKQHEPLFAAGCARIS